MCSCGRNRTGPGLAAVLQAYPEFARTTFDQAPPGFSSACSELYKKHGKVIHHTAPGQGLSRLLQLRPGLQLHSLGCIECSIRSGCQAWLANRGCNKECHICLAAIACRQQIAVTSFCTSGWPARGQEP